MDENKERGKGMMDQVAGKARQAMGNITGNEDQAAQGRAQELGGETRQEAAKGVGQAKGSMDSIKGNVKQGIGGLTGDDSMQAEGQWDEAKGNVRRTINE